MSSADSWNSGGGGGGAAECLVYRSPPPFPPPLPCGPLLPVPVVVLAANDSASISAASASEVTRRSGNSQPSSSSPSSLFSFAGDLPSATDFHDSWEVPARGPALSLAYDRGTHEVDVWVVQLGDLVNLLRLGCGALEGGDTKGANYPQPEPCSRDPIA